MITVAERASTAPADVPRDLVRALTATADRLRGLLAANLAVADATAAVTRALLSESDSPAVLRLVMTRARALVDADTVLITRRTGDSEETVDVMGVLGDRRRHHPVDPPGSWSGRMIPMAGTVTQIVYERATALTADLGRDARMPTTFSRYPLAGALAAVPLAAGDVILGVLVVMRARDRPPFDNNELDTVTQFAGQVALALEFARIRTAAERSRLVQERDRIARDMHDHVLGRLFGTGMALQNLSRRIADPAGRATLATQVDELDAAMRDLRTLIYGLDRDPAQVWNLRARLQQTVDEAGHQLAFLPTLDVDPTIDLPPHSAVVHNLLAVLREALSNIARHASATAVTVTVGSGSETGPGSEIVLCVADDGRGMPADRPRPTAAGGHGLVNILARADAVGGALTVGRTPGGGTTLRWSAPLPQPVGPSRRNRDVGP